MKRHILTKIEVKFLAEGETAAAAVGDELPDHMEHTHFTARAMKTASARSQADGVWRRKRELQLRSIINREWKMEHRPCSIFHSHSKLRVNSVPKSFLKFQICPKTPLHCCAISE